MVIRSMLSWCTIYYISSFKPIESNLGLIRGSPIKWSFYIRFLNINICSICSLWTKYFAFFEYIIPEFGKSHYRAIFCSLFYIWNGLYVYDRHRCYANIFMGYSIYIKRNLGNNLLMTFSEMVFHYRS